MSRPSSSFLRSPTLEGYHEHRAFLAAFAALVSLGILSVVITDYRRTTDSVSKHDASWLDLVNEIQRPSHWLKPESALHSTTTSLYAETAATQTLRHHRRVLGYVGVLAGLGLCVAILSCLSESLMGRKLRSLRRKGGSQGVEAASGAAEVSSDRGAREAREGVASSGIERE